jgi:hypothetical protein
VTDDRPGSPADRHRYAVVGVVEEAVDVSTAFVVAGLDGSERVILVGSTEPTTTVLLTRLRHNGADPARALRNGQLVIVDQARTHALDGIPPEHAVEDLKRQAAAAVQDGYTGIRFGGMLPRSTVSPHEHTLSRAIGQHPATALCLYHAQATAEVLHTVHHLHDQRVPSTAIPYDTDLRITAISPHRLEMIGRVGPGNRDRVLATLGEAAGAGHRTITAASLDITDRETLHAITALGVGLIPSPTAQRITGPSAAPVAIPAGPDATGRNGFPIPGHTATTMIANLIWRTYGTSRPDRAESVLDWAGLLGRPAAPITEVAARHRIATATMTTRTRHVQHRGSQTPLTPLQLRDATRAPHPTEDLLSRYRITQLLGLPPPPPRTT